MPRVGSSGFTHSLSQTGRTLPYRRWLTQKIQGNIAINNALSAISHLTETGWATSNRTHTSPSACRKHQEHWFVWCSPCHPFLMPWCFSRIGLSQKTKAMLYFLGLLYFPSPTFIPHLLFQQDHNTRLQHQNFSETESINKQSWENSDGAKLWDPHSK